MTIEDQARSWKAPDRWGPLAIVLVYLVLHMATLTDYGITWDCNELYVGDSNLHYYLTLDSDYLDYTVDKQIRIYDESTHPDLYQLTLQRYRNATGTKAWEIWPVGSLASSISKYIFYGWLGILDPFDAHHLPNVAFGVLLLGGIMLFGKESYGLWGGVVAGVGVVSHPRFWAHLHNNFKDVPSVLLFAAVILTFYWGTVNGRWRWLVGSAVLWGTAMATKGNALLLPAVLIPWFTWVLVERWRRQEPMPAKTEWLALAAYPMIGLGVMVLLWPYLLIHFPEHVTSYVNSLLNRGFESAESQRWNGLPLLQAIVTTPLPILILTIIGFIRMIVQTCSARRLDSLHLLLVIWLVIPILRVSLPGTIDFDVIRHWLEFIPAMTLIAGLGTAWLIEFAERYIAKHAGKEKANSPAWKAALLAACFMPTLVWSFANHPYQVAYYNCLIGGLQGAQARQLPQATDYWGSSYRQGLAWLNENAEQGALITGGAGEHMIAYSMTNWARDDLRFYQSSEPDAAKTAAALAEYPGAVYLMTITRVDSYTEFVRTVDQHREPIWEIRVDGAPILKIFRLR